LSGGDHVVLGLVADRMLVLTVLVHFEAVVAVDG
jgi:hypothetical protein